MVNPTRELATEIYARMVSAIYKDLSKAREEDLSELAQEAIRAAQVFEDVLHCKL
jgi:hypothetical protein